MNFLNPIYTEKAECQDCYKCVRECPVKAIKIESGHAEVMKDRCVYCGHCVEVCPVGAKRVRDDLSRVKQLLKFKDKVIVSLAPSFVSDFADISSAQMIHALRKLGFYGVSETSLGAQNVSACVAVMLSKENGKVYVSSACPTVVEYIKKYQPELSGYVTKLLSPLLAHCKILRKLYGEDIGVVFVGPCISKKREADTHQNLLDVVITFEDLRRWFEEENINPAHMIETVDDVFIPRLSKEGALYPIDGGMIAGIKANCSTKEATFMAFSGIKNIKSALSDLDQLDLNNNIFIEMLSCEGGCINGPKTRKRSSTALKRCKIINYSEYPEDEIPRQPEVDINEDIQINTIEVKEYTDEELRAVLRAIGKFTLKDELNCSACGYDTCKEFARAFLDGKAEKTMCVSYMRKLAHNKANALIKAMPSGVVIVDENLRIIECNHNFAKLFGKDVEMIYDAKPGMEGASLQKILPFYNIFQVVLETGKELLNKPVRHKSSILNITIFSIEKHSIVGAVIQDITVPSVRKEQVINKTQQVIRKNLETVQKIAYLLGENASETEVILNSVAESFLPSHIDENEKENE